MKSHDGKERISDNKNVLEWSVFAISFLFVFGLFVYLIYQSVFYLPSSPDLVISYKHDPSPNAPFRFHVTFKNKGFETAEGVIIELIQEKKERKLKDLLWRCLSHRSGLSEKAGSYFLRIQVRQILYMLE